MPRTRFTSELMAILPALREGVAALNQLSVAYEAASDALMDAFDDSEFDDGRIPTGYDVHPANVLRDSLIRKREELFTTISCIANDFDLDLRFNRAGGTYVLLDRP